MPSVRIPGRALPVAVLLGGCLGSTDPVREPAITNQELAAVALLVEGDLAVAVVRESHQAGRDLNGDGDALDDVVHALDLATGELTNLGLAVVPLPAFSDAAPPLLAVGEQALAIGVSEASQGATDLNGDGDSEDLVLHGHVRSTRTTRNLRLAVDAAQVGGTLLSSSVSEAAQGGLDLDGNGFAVDGVLHVHDLVDGSTVNLQLQNADACEIADGVVAFRTAESAGLDLNFDGDDTDPAVLQLYDAVTHQIHNPALAVSGCVSVAGGAFGFLVDEFHQGQTDLNADGDGEDAVFHVYDPASRVARNLGLTASAQPVRDASRFLLLAPEAGNARDLNADGDQQDEVFQVHDIAGELPVNTGLASLGSAGQALFVGPWLAASVSEEMQGGRDLDGDGDADGHVVHVREGTSGLVLDLSVDSFFLAPGGERLLFLSLEEFSGQDWNGDGDRSDAVLFDWDSRTRRLRNSNLSIVGIQGTSGEVTLVLVSELEEGEDANADGDADDLVLGLYDANAGGLRHLGLATRGSARLAPAGRAAALVSEADQGADLNGDGDRLDDVLHVIQL